MTMLASIFAFIKAVFQNAAMISLRILPNIEKALTSFLPSLYWGLGRRIKPCWRVPSDQVT
jgi:hypothetical protein